MSKELEVFNYNGNNVRTVIIDGEVWFVAKDVCDVLEIQNSNDAVRKMLDDDEKGIEKIYTHGGVQDMTIISENGYLMNCKGERWNMPTQKSMDKGLFEVKKVVVNNPDGSTKITHTTKVTGKGQIFFVNAFLAQEAV